jgi:hypothetical protein
VQGFIGFWALRRKGALLRNSIFTRIGVAAIAGCIAVGALAVAGCGGGDDSTTTEAGASGASGAQGSTPLSEDEFVSQGNEACAEANDQTEALQLPGGDEPITALAEPFRESAQITQEAYDKLVALTPPEDLEQKFNEFLAQGKAAIADAEKAADAAEAGDTQEVQTIIDQAQQREKQTDALASSIGLDECAKDVQPQSG